MGVVLIAGLAGPAGPISRASISWPDAAFKGELGSMPLGNGDLAANVWVDGVSGDLLFYLAKSDAFDQNTQPIKVGRVRLSFTPALWSNGSTKSSFSQQLDLATGSVLLRAGSFSCRVWVDALSPALRVEVNSTANFDLRTTLEVYRTRRKKTALGRGFCTSRYDIPDTVVNSSDNVLWFHRNDNSLSDGPNVPSVYIAAKRLMGVSSPDDPFANLTFGGRISAIGTNGHLREQSFEKVSTGGRVLGGLHSRLPY